MKIAPVSADLVIKLALIAGGIGLAWYVYKRTAGAALAAGTRAIEVAGEVADAVIVGTNPINPANWVNRGVSAAGGAIVSDTGPGRNADGSWNPGAWLFDITHPGWMNRALAPSPATTTPSTWGREARTMAPLFNDQTDEVVDQSQLANLGAP